MFVWICKIQQLKKKEKNKCLVVSNFLNWVRENKITFVESEKRLYSRKNWYAGTCDLLLEKDGRKFIADIKTPPLGLVTDIEYVTVLDVGSPPPLHATETALFVVVDEGVGVTVGVFGLSSSIVKL